MEWKGRRIEEHPILGPLPPTEVCSITVNGEVLLAREEEPILAALLASGIWSTRLTEKFGHPRGLYCGIGCCSGCLLTVDGEPNTPSCTTRVREGMRIETPEVRG